MESNSNHGLGILLEVARGNLLFEKAACAVREELEKERKAAAERESALLEKAANLAKRELKEELSTARKAQKANSYCWTTKDVMREFEVHKTTIQGWRRRLGLPFRKFGHNVKFRPGDVRRWAAQRKEG